jgi:hypothetical protein
VLAALCAALYALRSAAHDPRNHQDLLCLWIELVDPLRRATSGHPDRRGATLTLLLKDALRLFDGSNGFRITRNRSCVVPCYTIVTMVRQYS